MNFAQCSGMSAHESLSRSILLVDDETRSALALARLLRSEGFSVEVLNDGKSAVERLTCGQIPDLLVLDLHMPEIDGNTVAKLARQKSPALPIIMATGYPFLAQKIADGDEPEIVIKPIDYPCFVGTINRLMKAPVSA